LHALLFAEGWTADSVGVLLAHPASVSFIAYANDPLEPAGFLLGQRAVDQGEILSLGVRRDQQRCGIGRRLVAAFMEAARESGVCNIFLEVASGNVAARRLYEDLGFVQAGRRPRYYRQPGGGAEDALTLTVVLPPAKAHSR
jgi:ribosomal-protein-alanine N-acetyltransferase